MLGTPPAENVVIFVALFGALPFSKKQFPQTFHSKIGSATLCKLFKKDLFSSQNRRFFDARGGVTLVQTDRPSRQMARGPRNSRAGRKKRPLKNAKTPCTAIPAMRNGKSINQTMG
jgi:hypothetical protein